MNPGRKMADHPPNAIALGIPTRSWTQTSGTERRSAVRSVALDLGKKIYCCEVKNGKVVERKTVRELKELLCLLGPDTPPARVAIEACREAWFVEAELRHWGKEPVLVDTTRSKQLGIGQHGRKTDRIDAEVLARAVERGIVPRAHLLSPHRQQLRYQLGVRRMLVETRAHYITAIRGLARAHGVKLKACDSPNFVRRLRESELGEELRALVAPMVCILEQLDVQIVQAGSKVEFLSNQEPAIARLMTVPGVGRLVAAILVSVIDHPWRFGHAHEVESYLGLVPSEDTSGQRRLGGITKHGNRYLRAMLIQAGWSILRFKDSDDPLVRWGQAVAARRGKRIAVVGLARRIAGIAWAVWRDGTVYEPSRMALANARGVRPQSRELLLQARAIAKSAYDVEQQTWAMNR
jgi:transposase